MKVKNFKPTMFLLMRKQNTPIPACCSSLPSSPHLIKEDPKEGSCLRFPDPISIYQSLNTVRILDYRARSQQTSSKLKNPSHPERPHYSETEHKIVTLDIHKCVFNCIYLHPAPYSSLSSLTSGLHAKQRKIDMFLT